VRSLRGVLAASVCLFAVPLALLFELSLGSGAELVLHLVLGGGFLLAAFAVFDFEPPRWLPWVGCLSIGALGATFLLQGISQLLHNERLTYLAFQVLGQQFEAWSVDVVRDWGDDPGRLCGNLQLRRAVFRFGSRRSITSAKACAAPAICVASP
jgi:hypothetical protein